MTFRVINTQSYLNDEARKYLLDNECEIEDLHLEPMGEDEMIEALQGVDAVVAGGENYTRKVLEALPDLKSLARTGAGVDKIDLDAATECGVQVTNTPGATTDAVADLTVGLTLSVLRHIPKMDCELKKGNWNPVEGRELSAMTFGVVGVGSIGKGVATRAKGFGPKIVLHDVEPDQDFARELGAEYVSLDELLKSSDVVALCVSLNDSTVDLIGERELGLMKNGAYLINTSRPAVVNKKALLAKLEKGELSGAAVDVHDPKPCDPDDPLVLMDNVVATPWVAYNTADAKRKMCAPAVRDLVAVLQGKAPKFPVNQVPVKA